MPEPVSALYPEGLRRHHLDPDPMRQFASWFSAVDAAHLLEPASMTLSNAGKDGVPSARVVLLKAHDARGFTFFTNYASRKGQQLEENTRAALTFYWAPLERQVCVQGNTSRVSRKESELYFKSRPRGSQVGAWASRQSQILKDRADLEQRFAEAEERFKDQDAPLPDYWGGYLLEPFRIEFWQARPSRLHDRFVYLKEEGGWKIERLSP